MAVLKQRVQEMDAKKKLIDQSRSIDDRIRHLHWMHAWSQVELGEGILAEAEEKVRSTEAKIDEKQKEFEEKSGAFDNHNRNHEAAVAVKADVESDLAPIRQRQANVKEQFDNNKAELLQNTAERRRMKTDIDSARGDISKYEGQIEEEQGRIEAAQGPAQARKLAQLDEAKELLEVKRREENELDKSALDATLADASRKAQQKLEDVDGPKQRAQAAETRLRGLQSKEDQQMAAFHPQLSNLLRAINNEPGFRTKPVGPMAMHIRLLQPEWSSVIESWFATALDAFVVTNKQDQTLLTQLMRRVGWYVCRPHA